MRTLMLTVMFASNSGFHTRRTSCSALHYSLLHFTTHFYTSLHTSTLHYITYLTSRKSQCFAAPRDLSLVADVNQRQRSEPPTVPGVDWREGGLVWIRWGLKVFLVCRSFSLIRPLRKSVTTGHSGMARPRQFTSLKVGFLTICTIQVDPSVFCSIMYNTVVCVCVFVCVCACVYT